MSDYTLQATWSTKDALATGSALKAISATELGTEFSAIETAIATKYDSNDIASQAQAEAESSNAVLITPARLANWADYNDGIVGDLQALAATPAADRILFYDFSNTAAGYLTIGTGLAITTTTIATDDSAIVHDNLSGFVADEHVAHTGVTLTAGAGLTGGGDISANRTFAVGAGSGITVNADDVAITDVAAGANNPVNISSGTFTFDVTALGAVEGSALAATDTLLVDASGTASKVAIQDFGLRSQTAQTTQTLAASDMNSIMEFTGTATLTLPLNATVDLPVGVPVILNVKHATQVLTVTAAASVTLVSVNHPGGTAAASDTVQAGGTAILYKTATDVWCLAGDISD